MNVLVISPHPDDEVLGCGGTILKYREAGDDVYVAIVTRACEPIFPRECADEGKEECLNVHKFLGVKETVFMDFPASMVETVPRFQFNDAFIKLIQRIKPEIVYLPHCGDMQLDHKFAVDAAMVALRPKYQHKVQRIYAYETLSETGWDVPNTVNEFVPTRYVDIGNYLDKKIRSMEMYKSQLEEYPNARSIKAIRALAEYRGAMMGLRAAEAFVVIRDMW